MAATPATRPLRRRAARLVGEWVARVEGDDRPPVYGALLAMLAEDDMCMKVCVCNCSTCGTV